MLPRTKLPQTLTRKEIIFLNDFKLFKFRQRLINQLLIYLNQRLQDRGIKTGASAKLQDFAHKLLNSDGIQRDKITKSASQLWEQFNTQFLAEMGSGRRVLWIFHRESSMREPVAQLLKLIRTDDGIKISNNLSAIASEYPGHKIARLATGIYADLDKIGREAADALEAKRACFKKKLAKALHIASKYERTKADEISCEMAEGSGDLLDDTLSDTASVASSDDIFDEVAGHTEPDEAAKHLGLYRNPSIFTGHDDLGESADDDRPYLA